MDSNVYLIILLGALLHAGWNSILKLGLDRFSTVILLAIVQATIAIPLLFFATPPKLESWHLIIFAALLHTGYKIFLIRAYQVADLSQVYPVARGTAPLLLVFISIFFLGESFSNEQLLAIVAISFGIVLLTFKGNNLEVFNLKGIFFAIITACFTASYSLVDGYGAKLAESVSGFILWMVVFDAIGMIIFGIWFNGTKWFTTLYSSWKPGLLAGIMSLGAYWLTVWAFTIAPIPLVASLRESSILFASFIAVFFLKEKVNVWRWVASIFIVFGIIAMKTVVV
ncbi:DMT family transporter [Celerinatantimonas diazotrophica]|uniref:EamA-like transporter family protein n=1 Tax=Celerinatantimonas diazotrophica TaxID=412034 RepID=A0A4R1JA87_9GAMM|nr:DMT family transporter [Celerinatantimonas diazotrophica]TCK47553.1 EamA-like transporter family protein [Celerinatantimonas diazotrophica]CAG9296828.1 hypothetical protein CEDIAZO_01986 [Celerinatantimonas diazotrophica]